MWYARSKNAFRLIKISESKFFWQKVENRKVQAKNGKHRNKSTHAQGLLLLISFCCFDFIELIYANMINVAGLA